MPAERSGCLALSPDWADGWCRTTAAGHQTRNPQLTDTIRVPALRTAATCQACARTRATGQPHYRQAQASHNASHKNSNEAAAAEQSAAHRQPAPANEHGSIAQRYLSNSFILSEVRKALRHHPEATTAIRIHFDELVDRLEAESAGPQERDRRAA